MAKQLVKAVDNTKLITGRFSIQGALKRLGTAESRPGGKVHKGSTGFICSSELTASIVDDPAALEILTDLYDRNYNVDDWDSTLKMEVFALTRPTLSMLTATNEAHSEEFFIKRDIQGGYFARTFIIYEKERHRLNSLMFPLKTIIDYKKNAEYLKKLGNLSGEVKMDDSVRKYIDEWYHDFKRAIDDQKTKDPTGTLNRFDDSMLKVAMLISLGHSPELTIGQDAVDEAIKECEKLIGNVRKTTMGSGKHQFAQEKALVIEELIRRDNHSITRQQLNKKYYLRASSAEWDSIMEDLAAAGVLQINNEGSNRIYHMPDIQVNEWKQHLSGK
jgi:hypothetical protein